MTREEVDAAIHALVFETLGIRRYVQDGPIRPDVWINYILAALAGKSDARVSLIITPKRTSSPEGKAAASPAAIAKALKSRLKAYKSRQGKAAEKDAPCGDIGLTTRYIVADLTYEEMFTCALPLTDWWNRLDVKYKNSDALEKHIVQLKSQISKFKSGKAKSGQLLKYTDALQDVKDISLIRLAIIAGTIESLINEELKTSEFQQWAHDVSAKKTEDNKLDNDEFYRLIENNVNSEKIARDDLAEKLLVCLDLLKKRLLKIKAISKSEESTIEKNTLVWGIELNRPASPPNAKSSSTVSPSKLDKSLTPSLLGVELSRNTVKADAAIRLFNLSTRNLTWAIVDTGIDSDHPAFCDWDSELREGERSKPRHRISAAYDFTRLRQIQTEKLTENELKKIVPDDLKPKLSSIIDAVVQYNGKETGEVRDIDWASVGPILRIYDEVKTNTVPSNPHGTHVAGILAGWLPAGAVKDIPSPFYGVCPDIRLYDLRVFSDDPKHGNDEFTILAALDFISWLNRDPEQPVIHGVNLSLSLRHQVDAHACGRTPICEAANRLTYSGAVVVAAAGNAGYEPNASRENRGSGYRDISITDPGNAEEVICVGATHRSEPHTYGVSFFSSRGPTGDGRQKPDLVAPGEKIRSSIPGEKFDLLDGTSMAAPHVSGVCALLMARHRELIGEPARIKDILKKTATDLGRTPEFQGAGLVDALRALQSL